MPQTDIIDHIGFERKLLYKAPSSDKLMMRTGRTNIQTIRSDAGMRPLILPSEFVERDFVSPYGPRLISNQQSCGGCTGWSSAGALTRQRLMRMMADVGRLSGAMIYAGINGGRDAGSNIIDSLNEVETVGTCLETTMDFPEIYNITAAAKAEAARFKEDVAITIGNSAEVATAVQMGILVQVPIYVGNIFENFSGDGVAGVERTGQGNHSIYIAGMTCIAGVWYFIMVNSWSPQWGPFIKSRPLWAGCCLLSFAAIDNCADIDDGYGHASIIRDPQTMQFVPQPAPLAA